MGNCLTFDLAAMKNSMAIVQNTLSNQSQEIAALRAENRKLNEQFVNMNVAFHYLNVLNNDLRKEILQKEIGTQYTERAKKISQAPRPLES